jgi:hypothetical protein
MSSKFLGINLDAPSLWIVVFPGNANAIDKSYIANHGFSIESIELPASREHCL